MPTTIKRALEHTTVLKRAPGDIAALRAERDHLQALRQRLLPFEAGARASLDEQIEVVNLEIKAIDLSEKTENLPRLDPVVFTWTKPQASPKKRLRMMEVPALAFIPIYKDELLLTVDTDGDAWVNHKRPNDHFPRAIDQAYRNIASGLTRHIPSSGFRMNLRYTFPGIVPEEVREVIAGEDGESRYNRPTLRRFDSLAFVCEVDRWQVELEEAPRMNLDPILVGVKGGECWVLTSFDPTTLESYVASEFTS